MASEFTDSRYSRDLAARYYDLQPSFPHDIPFYLNVLSSPDARVLVLQSANRALRVAAATVSNPNVQRRKNLVKIFIVSPLEPPDAEPCKFPV